MKIRTKHTMLGLGTVLGLVGLMLTAPPASAADSNGNECSQCYNGNSMYPPWGSIHYFGLDCCVPNVGCKTVTTSEMGQQAGGTCGDHGHTAC